MVVNKKVTGKSKPMMAGLAIGSMISLMLTLLGAAIVANLVLSEKIETEAIGYGAIIILILASSAGAWVCAVMVKRRWMLMCLGGGGSYYLSLLAITALFFGGQYEGMGVTALAVLGGSGAVGLLGIKGDKSSRKRSKNRRFR